MKILRMIGTSTLAALLGLFLASCTAAAYVLGPVDLPQDLDRYLLQTEGRLPGITPGAEKTIAWAGRPGAKTPVAIIYLHGFTATRQEVAPVYEKVARVLDANVYYTRLTGHGMSGEALGAATLNDWVNDAGEAYQIGTRIGDRIVVAATSTGAPLALWLASQETPAIAALVLASANMKPADANTELLLWPWPVPGLVLRLAVGPYRTVPSKSDLDARYWTKRYPSKALLPMMATVKLGRQLKLQSIHVPSLWVYTDKDDVVSLEELKKCYQRIGSGKKRLLDIPDAKGHVLAGAIQSPRTTDEMAAAVIAFLGEAGIR